MSNKTETSEKLWNRNYIMVLLVCTLSAFSFYTNQTILSKHLTSGIGASMTLAGTIVGLFSLTSLFCRPFCGLMADRMNKIVLMIISNILMTVGLIGFAFARSIPLFIVMRIINGIGFAIGSTAQVALCTCFIPKSRMGEGIGYMGLSMVLASAAAPGLGIAISQALGMQAVFLASAAMPVAGCILLMFMHSDAARPKHEKRRIRLEDILEWHAWAFSLCGGMFSFINGIINAYIVLYSDLRGIADISLYFTVYAVFLFFIRPLSGKLMDKKGIRLTVLPAMLLTAVSMIILARSTSFALVILSAILRAIGQGTAQPSLQAGCINYIGRDRSGVATSTYYLFGDVGQGIGPMLGGMALETIAGIGGYQFLFYACAALLTLGFVIFERFSRKNCLR
ncbi:MAG: MFS transporter [Clostridia bacterium]|nr:MFS transporter [Clostridia bacterium]